MSRKDNNQNSSTKEREEWKTDKTKANDTKHETTIYANKSIKPDSASKDDNTDKNRNKNDRADHKNSNSNEKKERV